MAATASCEPAGEATLTILDVDAAFSALAARTGPGSVERRQQLLDELMAKATSPEQKFLRKLFLGDLGQGALEGIVIEAVARAAEVPADLARRALMPANHTNL